LDDPDSGTLLGNKPFSPSGLAVDGAGNVFISETSMAGSVLKVPPSGGPGTTFVSGLNEPGGLALDSAGNLFIADSDNLRVLEVPAGGGAPTSVGNPAYINYFQ
jgi:sugar lactone lactonase YvrE